MKQLTLAALYGQKNTAFKQMIHSIWETIEDSDLRRIFIKHPMDQIHGTMVGMEKIIGFERHFNANIWEKEEKKKEMDFSNIFSNIDPFFPMKIQFGGFQEDFDGFMSFDDTPYNRSFEINWKAKKIILIGWSLQEGTDIADNKLFKLRQKLYERNHLRPKMDNDNDFYMVIGELAHFELFDDEALAELKAAAQRLEKVIRDQLFNKPQEIMVTTDDLFFVRYQKESLEVSSSEAWNIKNSEKNSYFVKDLF